MRIKGEFRINVIGEMPTTTRKPAFCLKFMFPFILSVIFVNKKTHFVASWYQPPVDGHLPVSDNGNDLLNSLEKFDNLFREQLDKIKNINKGNKPPLIHVLGDFNFRDIVWPDRLSKSGSSLSQTEGQILIDIMNDHGLEQLVNFPTRERILWT